MDLLLSSGFLAFARHIGFLDGLSHDVDAVVGTSSGSVVGALYLAGLDLDAIAEELASTPPRSGLSLSWTPWRGLLSTRKARRRLQQLLPQRIEDLSKPFAVGVMNAAGEHELITSGELVPAVMASCAMPILFEPLRVNDAWYRDGGAVDRLGVAAWRRWRPQQPAIAHWVERSAGKDVEVDLSGVTVVRTPRSGAKLWSLGDFHGQRAEAAELTRKQLAASEVRALPPRL